MTDMDFTARGLLRKFDNDLASTAGGRGASLIGEEGGGTLQDMAGISRAALKAKTNPADGQAAYLRDGTASGRFAFDASDLSAQVSVDTAEGVYLAPGGSPSGVNGAWVRQLVAGQPLTPDMFHAPSDGTDAQAELEAMIAVAAIDRLPVHIPPKTYSHSDVLVWDKSIPSLTGESGYSRLAALTGFPALYDPGTGNIAAPQLYMDMDGLDRGTFVMDGIVLDGADFAPVGFWIVSGANHRISDIDCQDHTSANYVIDSVQNSMTENMRPRRSAGANVIVKNGTYDCTFINTFARKADSYNLIVHEDATAPGYGLQPVATPGYCAFIGGILEDSFDGTSKSGCASFTHMTDCLFETIKFVGGPTITGLEGPSVTFGAGATRNRMVGCLFNNKSCPFPAIDMNGFDNQFERIAVLDAGASGNETDSVIKCSTRATFRDLPAFNNCFYTGKLIENDSASPTDARVVTLILPTTYRAGTTSQRPDLSDIDGHCEYFDTTLDKLIYWDFSDANWRLTNGASLETLDSSPYTIANGAFAVVSSDGFPAGSVFLVTAHQTDNGANRCAYLVLATTAGKTSVALTSTNVTVSTSGNSLRVTNNTGAEKDFHVSVNRLK